jgi:putative adenylate-forming enzyme
VLRERSAQERSCRWTPARLQAHQAQAVEQLRRFALTHSPFYREFHRGREQRPLQDLPILTKATLMERFDGLVTDRSIRLTDIEAFLRRGEEAQLFRDRYVVLATSGSTGRRGVFLFDEREWIRAIASITRPVSWSQSRPPARKRPRAALIAAGAPWHYSARVGRALSNRIAPALRLDAATPVDELVARLNEWQPQALATYPSVLRQLAAEQLSGKLHISLRNVATSAEVLGEDTRAAVKRAWAISVQDTYGATEYAPIASECEHGRKHLFENGAVIEVVDDSGRVLGPRERGTRLLLTVFGRLTQPLIRYEISDMVCLTGEPCPCGRPYRTIDAIEGRLEDILYFDAPGGGQPVPVHPNRFHDALERFAVTAWQVVQDESGLTVRLIGANEPGQQESVASAMREMLESTGARVPSIAVQRVDRLERGATGKAPLILSRVRRPG